MMAARRQVGELLRIQEVRNQLGMEEESLASGGVWYYELEPELTRLCWNASFFGDIAEIKNPVSYIFSKLLNTLNQHRKIGTAVEKLMFPSAAQRRRHTNIQSKWAAAAAAAIPIDKGGAGVRAPKRDKREVVFEADYALISQRQSQFRDLVVCGLLGNYPHVPIEHRVGRADAVAALVALARSETGFQSMLHQASNLIVWAIREFIVHVVIGDRGLYDQVRVVMNFDAFRALTQEAMHTARVYLRQNSCPGWSALGRSVAISRTWMWCTCLDKSSGGGSADAPCLYAPPACAAAHAAAYAWLSDITCILAPFDTQVHELRYYKAKLNAAHWLCSQPVYEIAPPVARVVSREEAEAQAQNDLAANDQDYAAESRMMDHLFRTRQTGSSELDYCAIMGAVQAKLDREARVRRLDRERAGRVFRYLSAEHWLAVQRVCSASGWLEQVVARFSVELGQRPDTVRRILELLQHRRMSTMPKLAQLDAARDIQRDDPVCYNLLLAAAKLVKYGHNGDKGIITGHFHADTVAAQIKAAQIKLQQILGGPPSQSNGEPGVIESAMTSLWYCGVCNHVYSSVREARARRPFYKFGLCGASIAFTTAQVFCDNGASNHRGKCVDTELTRVSLIGVRFALNKRTYQLCVSCADIMIPDTQACAYNQDGMLCVACTVVHRRNIAQQVAHTSSATALVCAVCQRSVRNAHLYPWSIAVCNAHHSPALVRWFERVLIGAVMPLQMGLAAGTAWTHESVTMAVRRWVTRGHNKRIKKATVQRELRVEIARLRAQPGSVKRKTS